MEQTPNHTLTCRALQTGHAPFRDMLDTLLGDYRPSQLPVRLVFFGEPRNNDEYTGHLRLINAAVTTRWGDKAPMVSYVAQPPCGAGLILEAHEIAPAGTDTVSYRVCGETPYILIEGEEGRSLFVGGVTGGCPDDDIRVQSDRIFRRIGAVLQAEQMPVDSIVRQWNYIEKITAFNGNRQHYQDFNDSRTHFYNEARWTNGYPAATGIGTEWGGVMIDLQAFLSAPGADWEIRRIDNPLQIAAHVYSDSVLLGEEDARLRMRTTPKFERAKAVARSGRGTVYISGTAAIRGEQSLKGVGLEQQTVATLENIRKLISRDNMNGFGIPAAADAVPVYFRVYLKHAADYAAAERLIRDICPGVPAVYTLADVCRDELLIEIEGLAYC